VFGNANLPSLLQIMIILAILSAIASTLDSEALLFSSIIVNDFLTSVISFNSCIDENEKPTDSQNQLKPSDDCKRYRNKNYKLTRGWSMVGLALGFTLTLIPIGLLDFLSVIWVMAISTFAVPLIGITFTWLKRGLREKFVKSMTVIMALSTVILAIILSNIGVEDLAASMINVAFSQFLIYFMITLIMAIIYPQNEKK